MKKNFQVVIFIMLAAVFSMSVSSCGSDEYSSPIKGKTVSDVTFESSQSTNSITIGDADLTGFTVTSTETWCVATAQGKNLNITVQPNTTYSDRQATITITDPGDQSVISFKILQKQNNAIETEGGVYTVSEEGGEIKVNIKSNVKYEVNIPSDASWLTVASKSSTRGLEKSTLVLKASKNDSGDERKSVVELTYKSISTPVKVYVEQGFKPSVSLDVDELEIDEAGGEIQVSVSSNTSLDTSYSEDWISSGGREETGGFNFIQKIKISPLPSNMGSRTAKVEFTDKLGKWNISKVVTIKQVKSLSIKDSDVEILIGKSHTLEVINNTGKSLIWMSSDMLVATVSSIGTITGLKKGTTTITVMTVDGKYSDKINVTVIEKEGGIVLGVEYLDCGTYKKFPNVGSYIRLNIQNMSDKKVKITKLIAYEYREVLNEISCDKQLDKGQFYSAELNTSKGSTIECYFYYIKWDLHINYTTLDDNQKHCEVIKFGERVVLKSQELQY